MTTLYPDRAWGPSDWGTVVPMWPFWAPSRRGARVLGVEFDAGLVEQARHRLARAGLEGEVVHGDIFNVDITADVIFTYLTPGTLQQLTPRLQALPVGTRLVTLDFAVPDLEPELDQNPAPLPLPAAERPPAAMTG